MTNVFALLVIFFLTPHILPRACFSQINIPNANLAEVGLELAGKGGGAASEGGGENAPSPAVDVSVVTVNSNQNTILFANTEFLASEAKGEVFDSENKA